MQNNLRSIRKRKGLTLKDLSSQTGLSIGLIGNFETGERGIGRDALEKVAAALSVQVAEILHEADDSHAEYVDTPKECPQCAAKDKEIEWLRGQLSKAQDNLASALASKPSPAAAHACGVSDREQKRAQ